MIMHGLINSVILILLINLQCSQSNSKDASCTKSSPDCDMTRIETNEMNDSNICKLYMAESSIPNAGYGIFSAIDIPEGKPIGSGDVLIPLPDNELGSLINSYPWRGKDHATHNLAEEVDNICPGLNAIVNGHTYLMNMWAKSADMDESDLHRSSDPGAGAFSYFHNLETIATAPIAAGMELFAEYGDNYFTSYDDKFANVPLSYEFVEADSILSKFETFMRSNEEGDITEEAFEVFWQFFKDNKTGNNRVLSLLPNNIKDLKRAVEIGIAQYNAPKELIRSTEWLESNGLCLDNLKEGKSTIAQAGRGAFANRHLPKGSFVAPMPLLHECKHDAFLSTYGTTQLLLNYCFGHRSSTLKLCPYGSFVSLINHNQTSANVEIRWSTSKLHKRDWLETKKDELCEFDHAGLIFDIVATKDILPGEEIFMNYGEEWEAAWTSHVENWEPLPDAAQYISASTCNKEESIIRTNEEQEINPYPDNIYFECFFQDKGEYKQDGDIYYQSYNGHESNTDLHKCQILNRELSLHDNASYLYTVSMVYQPDYDEPYKAVVSNFPRNAIKFSDASYTSDMFLENVFRHEMMISDEIFPDSWKDSK